MEPRTLRHRYPADSPNSGQNHSLRIPPFPPTDHSLRSLIQVVLINAVKDVAKALGDLISATKAAAGKVGDDPAVWQLKNSAKVGGE